jgi:transcriptional antiterminator NusG
MSQQARWYIIQTYSGYENSVREDLLRRVDSMGMNDFIFSVIVPEETIIEKKDNGKEKEKIKQLYPGYVFVEMIVTDESWFVVRNTPRVTGFLGSSGGGTKHVPIPPEENKKI